MTQVARSLVSSLIPKPSRTKMREECGGYKCAMVALSRGVLSRGTGEIVYYHVFEKICVVFCVLVRKEKTVSTATLDRRAGERPTHR